MTTITEYIESMAASIVAQYPVDVQHNGGKAYADEMFKKRFEKVAINLLLSDINSRPFSPKHVTADDWLHEKIGV